MTTTGKHIQVKGLTALDRKLATAGIKARTAARRGLRRSGAYAVKVLRWVSPVETGATKKALGVRETRETATGSPAVFIGVLSNYTAVVKRKRLKSGKEKVGARRAKKDDNISALETRRPVLYSKFLEKRNPWFYPALRQIKPNVKRLMYSNIYKAVDEEIAKMKG